MYSILVYLYSISSFDFRLLCFVRLFRAQQWPKLRFRRPNEGVSNVRLVHQIPQLLGGFPRFGAGASFGFQQTGQSIEDDGASALSLVAFINHLVEASSRESPRLIVGAQLVDGRWKSGKQMTQNQLYEFYENVTCST